MKFSAILHKMTAGPPERKKKETKMKEKVSATIGQKHAGGFEQEGVEGAHAGRNASGPGAGLRPDHVGRDGRRVRRRNCGLTGICQ